MHGDILETLAGPLDDGNPDGALDAVLDGLLDHRVAEGVGHTGDLQGEFLVIHTGGAVDGEDQLDINGNVGRTDTGQRTDQREDKTYETQHGSPKPSCRITTFAGLCEKTVSIPV